MKSIWLQLELLQLVYSYKVLCEMVGWVYEVTYSFKLIGCFVNSGYDISNAGEDFFCSSLILFLQRHRRKSSFKRERV